MPLKSNMKTAFRSLTRRKTKNVSAILAISLGVTLLVGIQITTATLEKTFLTSLLLSEGEVDIRVTNATGKYLSSADFDNISSLVPSTDPFWIMPALSVSKPVMLGSQFDPQAQLAGIPLDYPETFGRFYDWTSGDILESSAVTSLLSDNYSALLSSKLAEELGVIPDDSLPLTVQTEFTNFTMFMWINSTGQPEMNTSISTEHINLSIVGIYNGQRPGIGAQFGNSILFPLERLQYLLSWADPQRHTDFVDSYLISFKADHFSEEIEEDFLQSKVDAMEANVPVTPLGGLKVYSVESTRLLFFDIMDFIFNMMSAFLNALGMLIITTGLLLITNIQLMSVEDREFQTGVMRAVGENRQGIVQTFLIETVIQGLVGGIFGLFGGIAFGWAVAAYLAGLFGTGAGSVTPVLRSNDIILSLIIGVVLAIITGILPSTRAARVNIVEALRGIKTQLGEGSSRNFIVLGVVLAGLGAFLLLQNGNVENTQWIWTIEGWDSTDEWRYILVGAGILFTGVGFVLSSFISRVKAMNLTALALWGVPVFAFLIGFEWIGEVSAGNFTDIVIFGIVEIIAGSVLIVGLNLSPLMSFLRTVLIRFKRFKGVAQISPALISSHKTRSTLTFAIFAVVLTLNVLVATLVATNLSGSVGEAEIESRGVDLVIKLSKPEKVLNDTNFAKEIYKLDDRITDVIPFKTSEFSGGLINLVYFQNPLSPDFNFQTDILPVRYIEVGANQIRGNATSADDDNWRYDFPLRGYPDDPDNPDGIRDLWDADMTDKEEAHLSRLSWDYFFDPHYQMTAYNVSGGFNFDNGFDSFGGGGFSGNHGPDPESALEDENGTVIQRPMVFTDSFLIPQGIQVWLPMNTSSSGYPNYQAFTVGGIIDFQAAGGFPLSPREFGFGDGETSFVGSIYMPERFGNMTNYFGEADGQTAFSRAPDQYDAFLIKTSLHIDSSKLWDIAQSIEEFTNTKDSGYRVLIEDNFIVVSAVLVYSSIEENLSQMSQMVNFLQIYVSFGLIVGAVGMAVISIRNVAERQREIGMMRAIGFPKSQVIASVLFELVVLGIIGLCIGVMNGLLINVGFSNLMGNDIVIPWNTIAIYLAFITIIAFVSGAIPGYAASRIPPSEALRYVG